MVQARSSRRSETIQIDRVKIRAAFKLGHSFKEIENSLRHSQTQMYYPLKHETETGKKISVRKAAIPSRKAGKLVNWLHNDPQNRLIPLKLIQPLATQQDIGQFGMITI